MADVPTAVADRRKRRREEYGQFVAVKRIYHGGALAFTPGRPVPASNVRKHGYDKRGLVRRRSAATAAAAEKKEDQSNAQ